MPPKASWYTRIPEILADLRQLDAPVADRHICELLFGVRRRRAIELMQRFGGYRSGNSILLDRCELIASLERVHGSPEVTRERRRKQRLGQELPSSRRESASEPDICVSTSALRRNCLPGCTNSPNSPSWISRISAAESRPRRENETSTAKAIKVAVVD